MMLRALPGMRRATSCRRSLSSIIASLPSPMPARPAGALAPPAPRRAGRSTSRAGGLEAPARGSTPSSLPSVLKFPALALGHCAAAAGEQHEAGVVHSAIHQAGAHCVDDRLLEPLPLDTDSPADGIGSAPSLRAATADVEKRS